MYTEQELAYLADHLSEDEMVQALAMHGAEAFAEQAGAEIERLERDLGRTLTAKERERAEDQLVKQFDDGKEPNAAAAFYGSLPDAQKAGQLWALHTATGRAVDPVNLDNENERLRHMEDRLATPVEVDDAPPEPAHVLHADATERERHDWMEARMKGDTETIERIEDVIQQRTAPDGASQ